MGLNRASQFLARLSEAKRLNLWRSTHDVLPRDVDHTYEGNGVFGTGTYYGLSYAVAASYASGFENFALVFKYSVSSSKSVTLTPDDVEGISHNHDLEVIFQPSGIKKLNLLSDANIVEPRDDLGQIALDQGFDILVLSASHNVPIDGGDQALIPKGSRRKPSPESFSLILYDKLLAKRICTALGSGNFNLHNPAISTERGPSSKKLPMISDLHPDKKTLDKLSELLEMEFSNSPGPEG